MAEGAILEPPETDEVLVEESTEPEAPQEVPSVFSVVNRYLVGGVEVSPPAEDGSRTVRLQSASGQALIEANLSPQLCAFLSEKLVAVEVIPQGEEAAPDAGPTE